MREIQLGIIPRRRLKQNERYVNDHYHNAKITKITYLQSKYKSAEQNDPSPRLLIGWIVFSGGGSQGLCLPDAAKACCSIYHEEAGAITSNR